MKEILKIKGIELDIFIDESHFKKDLKNDFINNIKLKNFDFLNNTKINSKIEDKELCYYISAENGEFIVFNDVPLYMNLGFRFNNEKNIEHIDKFIKYVGNLSNKISKNIIKQIQFNFEIIFLLSDKPNLNNKFDIIDRDTFEKKNKIKYFSIHEIKFLMVDEDHHGFVINVVSDDRKISISTLGTYYIDEKEEQDTLKLEEIYSLLKKKIEKIIVDIKGVN